MTIQELFIHSNNALASVVEQISGDQWAMPLPAGTSRDPTDLRTAVNYHAYDDAWVPDVLAGKTAEEVGTVYDYLRTTTDTLAEYQQHQQRANQAVQPFTELDRVTHLSYGDFPARDYLQHITSYRIMRAQVFARMIGTHLQLDPDFVVALQTEYAPVIEGYRQMGVFGPAVEVAEDADAQTRFFAMLGLG